MISAIFQKLHPSWYLSTSTLLLHVDFGNHLFILPSGAHFIAIFVLLLPYLLSVWPIHLHRLILMFSSPSLTSVSLLFVVGIIFKNRSIRFVSHSQHFGSIQWNYYDIVFDNFQFRGFHKCFNVTNASPVKESVCSPCLDNTITVYAKASTSSKLS